MTVSFEIDRDGRDARDAISIETMDIFHTLYG